MSDSISAMSGRPTGSGFGSPSGSTVRTRSYAKKPTAPPANGGMSGHGASVSGAVAPVAPSAATVIEHDLSVGERAAAAADEHREVVQDVGGLVVDAVVGLLARRAADLFGLLEHLLPREHRVLEQRDG